MSISSTANRIQYTGNGVTTAFSFPYQLIAAADLVVIETVTATGVQTTKALTTDYAISGSQDASGIYQSGCTVTAVTAPASTVSWTLYRDPAATQTQAAVDNDPLPASFLNNGLDKLTQLVQRTRDLIGRALVQPEGDSASIARLPAKVSRASLYLAFDANGDPIASPGATAVATPVSAFMATVLDDADAATARATLGAAGTGDANSFTADQTIVSTDASATVGPLLKLHRNSASPAASDAIGAVDLQGKNSTPATVSYGRIRGVIIDPVAATEDGQIDIQTMVAGTLTTILSASASGIALKGNLTKQVAQIVNTETGASATGTTVLPADNTIPQITEGDQYMSLSVTPENASSTLLIDVVFCGMNSGGAAIGAALFQDSTANALAAAIAASASNGAVLAFRHKMTAGTTSATTFKVRAGGSTAGTTTFNGTGGSQIFGGVMASSITITEILP